MLKLLLNTLIEVGKTVCTPGYWILAFVTSVCNIAISLCFYFEPLKFVSGLALAIFATVMYFLTKEEK